jgi:hypothetical protein
MTHATAAPKHKKSPHRVQAIEIAHSHGGGAKHSHASHNWRHAMSVRTRTVFRRLFVKKG